MTHLINPHRFGGVSELARDTTAFVDTVDRTIYTSDARQIGAASATRRVYALITATQIAARTLNSVTIGGVSASIDVSVSSGTVLIAAIASAIVPTGTTAVVVATFSSGMSSFACSVIALDNPNGIALFDSATGNSLLAAVDTGANLDFPAGGYAMAVAADIDDDDGSITIAWTNLTETVPGTGFGSDNYFGMAYRSIGSEGEVNKTITATWDSSDPTARKVIAALSVR